MTMESGLMKTGNSSCGAGNMLRHRTASATMWTTRSFGMSSEREAVDGSTETFLDGANGAFNFADMAVSCYDIEVDGSRRHDGGTHIRCRRAGRRR